MMRLLADASGYQETTRNACIPFGARYNRRGWGVSHSGRPQKSMRLVFVQHGDYRDAFLRFAASSPETYYQQRYTVDFVGGLAAQLEQVSVICVDAEAAYRERLDNRVTAIGLRLYGGDAPTALEELIEREAPTHVVLRTPIESVLRRALAESWSVLPLLADSFEQRGLRKWWRARRLGRLLRDPRIAWVGNHGVRAAQSLRRIGVPAEKILAFDLPPAATPAHVAAKPAPNGGAWRLIYVGALNWSKGLGDAIDALALLVEKGRQAALTVIGEDRTGEFARYAESCGIAQQVVFLGRTAHAEVLRQMHEHDVVLVPSRHDFPEGMPYTIYEAFCSRTPLVASDHPMFQGNVVDGVSGLIFAAGRPAALAAACERLMTSPELYRRLSESSLEAWRRLQLNVEWSDLIRRFLDGPEKHRAWLAAHSLAAVERERENVRDGEA